MKNSRAKKPKKSKNKTKTKSKQIQKNQPYKLSEFEEYAFFLALPRDERKKLFGFHTDIDFSEEWGVDNSTLSEWKKDDKLWELRNTYLKRFKQYTADVLSGLRNRAAKEGKASEVLAWMKIVEGWKEEQDINVKGDLKITKVSIIDE